MVFEGVDERGFELRSIEKDVYEILKPALNYVSFVYNAGIQGQLEALKQCEEDTFDRIEL